MYLVAFVSRSYRYLINALQPSYTSCITAVQYLDPRLTECPGVARGVSALQSGGRSCHPATHVPFALRWRSALATNLSTHAFSPFPFPSPSFSVLHTTTIQKTLGFFASLKAPVT